MSFKSALISTATVAALIVSATINANPPTTPEQSNQGIQVHGDWIIKIYNEDGSLDRIVEFSNGLAGPGARVLSCSLVFPVPTGHGWTPEGSTADDYCHGMPRPFPTEGNPWILFFGDSVRLDASTGEVIPGSSPCDTSYPYEGASSLQPAGCAIHDLSYIGLTGGPRGDGTDLTSEVTDDGALRITGSVEVETAGNVSFVQTQVEGYQVTPQRIGSHVFTFTSKSIEPVQVKAGELVEIQVTISFSSG